MKNKRELESDFQDFLSTDHSTPSSLIDRSLLSFIEKELNPSYKFVFLKLLAIQAVIGFLSLAFCPQFNLSLTHHYELFHFFHRTFGPHLCMAICGAIFIGVGAIFAIYLLKPEEILKIRGTQSLSHLLITGLSVVCFLLIGVEVYFNMMLIWSLGAFVGGFLMFELNAILKNKLIYRV